MTIIPQKYKNRDNPFRPARPRRLQICLGLLVLPFLTGMSFSTRSTQRTRHLHLPDTGPSGTTIASFVVELFSRQVPENRIVFLINGCLVDDNCAGQVAGGDARLLFHAKNLTPTQPIERFLQQADGQVTDRVLGLALPA